MAGEDLSALLSAIDQLKPQAQAAPESSIADKVLGYSRSYLNGPLFGFEPQLEAAISSLAGNDYNSEVSNIKQQQSQFLKENPITGNAVQIGSSIVLNPLDELNKFSQGAKYGLTTLGKIIANPVSQGAIAGVGNAAPGESLGKAALEGGVFGAAGSAAASVFGKTLQSASKEADKLKLSAFGIGAQDISKNVKKMGGAVTSLSELPLVQTVQNAEKAGIIKAGNDVLDNMGGVLATQDQIAGNLKTVLNQVDQTLQPRTSFNTTNVENYINGLSGTARNKAEEAATEEYLAVIDQMKNGGTLSDLQNAKIGLNYKFDANPYKEDVVKALRRDLKQEIEGRVDLAAQAGVVSPDLLGSVKDLNSQWGNLAELKDALSKKVAKDYGPDGVEKLFGAIRTTGGAGSLINASAATGNPIYALLGLTANMGRAPEIKSRIGDILRETAPLTGAVGDVLSGNAKIGGVSIPAPITARSVVQMANSGGDNSNVQQNNPQNSVNINDLRGLLSQLDAMGSQKKNDSITQQPVTQPAIKGGGAVKQDISLDNPDHLGALVQSVIHQESNNNPKAVGPETRYGTAKGLMQLIDSTGQELFKKSGLSGKYDPFNAEQNKILGTMYLKQLTDKYGGDVNLALAAYNWGPGNLDKLLKRTGATSFDQIQNLLPTETKNYRNQILDRIKPTGQVLA